MKKRILILAVITFVLAACSKNDSALNGIDPNVPVPVKFGTKGISLDVKKKVSGNTWEGTDRIGVFMKSSTMNLANSPTTSKAINIQYQPNPGDNALSPVGTAITYPINPSNQVEFFAYYPYVSGSNFIAFPINLTTTPNFDFLYASAVGPYNKTTNSVTLNFIHKLAKLKLNISTTGLTPAELGGFTVQIQNVDTQGSVNLETGIITTAANGTVNTILVAGAYETTVFPDVTSSAKKLIFTFPNLEGGMVFNEIVDVQYSEGTIYTYDVTLTRTGISGFRAVIADWINGSNTNVVLN